MEILVSSSSQGILWAIMAIGVFITYRILDLPDLSAEGSFPLGGCVCAVALINGIDPIVATILGAMSGCLSGLITGFLHTKLKIPALLSGIITLTGMYSINLMILGKSNVSLAKTTTLIKYVQSIGFTKSMSILIIGLIVVSLVVGLLILFLNTEIGLSLRATGDNYIMGQSNGIEVDSIKILGYIISNGLISLSGALIVQNNGFVDINIGVGTIVIGLSAIILSEVIIKHLSLGKRLISIIFGSIIYRLVIIIILLTSIDSQIIKLISAILLTIILCAPKIRGLLNVKRMSLNK